MARPNGHGGEHSAGDGHPGDESEAGDGHPGGGPGRDYDERPLVVTWEATQACGLACDHCRAEAVAERPPGELSTAAARALVDQVADFGSPPPVFVVSGGDPTERDDLLEVVSYATERGLPTAVTPAPTPSLTRQDVHDIADAGAHRIALSLDGATRAAHDGFRGEEGSFAAVERAAAAAHDAGIAVQVNSTVTARTVGDLPAMADRVAALDATMWEVFFLVPVGRGTALAGLDPTDAERTFAWLYDRARDAPFRVVTVEAPRYRPVAERVAAERGDDLSRPPGSTRAGKGFVFVSHRGNVYPSGFLPRAAGNVRADHLPTVYRESDLFRRLRDPDSFEGPCGNCPHRDLCGGSRSRAAAAGDPFGSDPLCARAAGATVPGPADLATVDDDTLRAIGGEGP